jgi:hypothetical protein
VLFHHPALGKEGISGGVDDVLLRLPFLLVADDEEAAVGEELVPKPREGKEASDAIPAKVRRTDIIRVVTPLGSEDDERVIFLHIRVSGDVFHRPPHANELEALSLQLICGLVAGDGMAKAVLQNLLATGAIIHQRKIFLCDILVDPILMASGEKSLKRAISSRRNSRMQSIKKNVWKIFLVLNPILSIIGGKPFPRKMGNK